MTFHKSVLPNGLRVITVPMADNPSVTVLVVAETGSEYESKEQSGISHFLEHMLFKGTPRRPKASDISRELDQIGAHYNAFTSQEFTGYYGKAAARHLDTLLDLIADMYQNPLFDEAEIKKEKGVIIEEVRMYQDVPQKHVQDVMTELLYGDQPAGRNVAGTEETIRSFTGQDFRSYHDGHYVSGATTIVVAGAVNQDEIMTKVEKVFATLPSAKKTDKVPVHESQTAPRLKAVFKATDQTHLVMAVRSFALTDPRLPAAHVLSSILGAGMSSRLFARMRDELGICYYINCSHDAATDHGNLSISAGVDNARVQVAVREILAECTKLCHEAVPERELRKVKDYLSGTTTLELETSDARAEFFGIQEVMKHKVEVPEDLIRKIEKVTAADIQALARELFVDSGLNLAVIGKSTEEELLPLVTFCQRV